MHAQASEGEDAKEEVEEEKQKNKNLINLMKQKTKAQIDMRGRDTTTLAQEQGYKTYIIKHENPRRYRGHPGKQKRVLSMESSTD